MKTNLITISLFIIALATNGQTAQFRGENRDGHYKVTGLLTSWPEEGPEMLYSVEGIGKGYSSPVYENGTIYITGQKDSMDYFNAIGPDGILKYSVPYSLSWLRTFADSRSTPTILDGKAYIVGGKGVVVCIDIESGNLVWSRDIFGEYDGRHGEWGIAESPLVIDGKVLYTPGGTQTTMVALDIVTGETVWATESLMDTTAYVSPTTYEYAGKRVIVGITARYVFGVDAGDGTFLWTKRYYDVETPKWHKWAPVINCITPIYQDGKIYVTSGYDHVGMMLELNEEGTQADIIWTDTLLDCHHGGVVVVDGYIYGSNWLDNSNGNWCCIEWETGKSVYEKEWYSKGSVITADGLLYCLDEKRGNMALVNPTPEDFEVISSFRIPNGGGPHWAHPAISEGKLLVRHGQELMVYDISNPTIN